MVETEYICVTGSRDWKDHEVIFKALKNEIDPVTRSKNMKLITGGARGADLLAEKIWKEYFGLEAKRSKPDWLQYGKAAGPRRNQKILDYYQPRLVLAFPIGTLEEEKSKGTWDMITRAQEAKIPVRIFYG